MSLSTKPWFLKSFAFLTHCTDQLNKEKTKFYQDIEESLSKIEKKIIFYTIELNKLPKEKSDVFSKTKYKNWIRNLKRLKKYQKSEIVESLLMEKAITSSSAWIKFFDQTMARLKFSFRGRSLTETEVLDLLTSSEKSIRKDAALWLLEELKSPKEI